MNKETIYIESSDDITDILSKLKTSNKKVIALVPPKKPSVLLSAINIKLIARTAKTEGKAVVLVSTDDSLTKLAMSANLPVAPSLKSRPVMPGSTVKTAPEKTEEKAAESDEDKESDDDEEEPDSKEEPEDSKDSEPEKESEDKEKEDDDDDDEDDDVDNEEDDDGDDEEDEDEDDDDKKEEKVKKDEKEKDDKKAKREGKKAKKEKKESSNPIATWLGSHKIAVIIVVLVIVGIVAFLIWAFTFAPHVKVSISVRTTSSNFSENVIFVKQPADEEASIGKFYIREEKVEKDQTVKFTATGKKDIGESATGTVSVIANFIGPGSITISSGTRFSNNGLDYLTIEDVNIAGPADMTPDAFSICRNYSGSFRFGTDACEVEASLPIKASAPGEDYNISATGSGWSTSSTSNIYVSGSSDISGGTSDIVTIVQQSDVDLALDKLKGEHKEDNKNELYVKIPDTVMPIDASFKVTTTDPKITPAVGEEVKEGTTPEISTKTTYTVYTVDRVRIEEFIKSKVKLEECTDESKKEGCKKEKLYSVGDPYIEYFTESGDNYSAKLKTAYKYGAEISETEVLDKIQGEKIGRIEPILKDAFSGVSSVKFQKSYFWVNSVPSNPNQVQIEITVEE